MPTKEGNFTGGGVPVKRFVYFRKCPRIKTGPDGPFLSKMLIGLSDHLSRKMRGGEKTRGKSPDGHKNKTCLRKTPGCQNSERRRRNTGHLHYEQARKYK